MKRRLNSGLVATILVLTVIALAPWAATPAPGEQSQRGDLIVALRGEISPLRLSRHEPDPVRLQLAGGLRTVDDTLLPRVRRVEIGLPTKGVISTKGLPTCTVRRLRNATSQRALAACRSALIGHGMVEADVLLPDQRPFQINARLLIFNGPRKNGHRLLLLHGFARQPPTTVVLPFALDRRHGRFGLTIGADLPAALGPWPHLARFEMNLGRTFGHRGSRSFLSASCPIPPRFTAGFFSLAKITYTLVDGSQVGIAITRGCRGR